MPTILKKEKRKKIKAQAVTSPKVNSYLNDPYFEQKARDAREAIRKFGLPPQNH
jgi:hypothetical protein